MLALVRDLMFASRIRATAAAAGVPLKLIREPSKLGPEEGRRLIVDLNLEGAIDAAADWAQQHGRPVVGFVSHVDAPTIQHARASGIVRVMARSQFVQALEQLLTEP